MGSDGQAEQYVRALMGRVNKRLCFATVGVEWRLVRSCGRSYVRELYGRRIVDAWTASVRH